MTSRIRSLIASAVLALLTLTACPHRAAAQPWLPEDNDNGFGGKPGMHLFLPSRFIKSIREDRLTMARTRYFQAAYRKAVNRGEYIRALAYTDSLIYLAEHRPIPGVRPTVCYQKRAWMLHNLNRNEEASAAYERAVKVRNSAMHLEQTEALREMQASYELDRLALDKALLTARHHKIALISLLLLLMAVAVAVAFVYASNRRTKRLQQELLRQMEQGHKSEEKKTAFINSICHEVRTPLNSIAGFSELLCTEEVSPEAHGQYCEIIHESRRQLRYLFDDMLEVAQLENLSEPLPRSYLDLCALCRSQLRAMKIRCPKIGLVYTDGIPAEQIAMVTSEKYLGILLAALLGNAYKFTRQGEIRLECGREGDERVYIAVTDSGCGIPPEKYDEVFERFTKLDPFSQGNGLGLYLCRLIVRHLGGEIRIDPQYTEGTRVVVVLPRK
ncbi:HAMP domain-containing histidine kinase [Alistipes sp. kh20]|uniref:sensor histidine kinase n=1 Tax=Alistipes montrealensis TaxID=2834113 RepID=UPI001BCD9D91|nr:HAMP domain-containing sensor histidine kinase [Alistipes montrealensis]MBS4766961.1 HAMP domain-containing histidine kinase [Alistipes montrealensis]